MVRREVQAVIFDEVDNGRKVLILKKIDYSSRRYRWRLLKGGLNDGETEIEGLRREIFEEIGLGSIRLLGKIHSYEYFFKGIRHTVSTYAVKVDSREPINLQKSEVADYMWTTKGEALQLLHWNNEKEALLRLR